MGLVVAIINIKGGVGKTTTAVNLGAGLALRGSRVLLIDFDAQGNLALSLGVEPKRSLYDVLVEGVSPFECITRARPNLDLLAADESLVQALPIMPQRSDWARTIDHAIKPMKPYYDLILIDSPGSLNMMSINALFAASEVIIPTAVEYLSIRGLNNLLKQIAHRTQGSVKVRMIIPTMYDARLRQSDILLNHLKETYGNAVTRPIRVNVSLSEASSFGKTIFEYKKKSRGAEDYARLVERLAKVWKLKPAGDEDEQDERKPIPDIDSTELIPPPLAPKKLPTVCPHCSNTLRHFVLAGHRIAYCDRCKFRQQQLMASLR